VFDLLTNTFTKQLRIYVSLVAGGLRPESGAARRNAGSERRGMGASSVARRGSRNHSAVGLQLMQ
jgi:hypothetical protein